MCKHKFSILVPAYKDKYLRECVESILCQTYANFELIIVDDASPHNISPVVEQFDDKRIKYYKNKMGFGAENVVKNWNKCLSYTSGNYVICMGDDDMLTPNCLESYNETITSTPDYNIYHIRTEIINENGDIVNLQEARPKHESIYSLLWHKVNNKRIQYIGDFCFKTDTLIKNGGFYELPYACFSDDISVYMASLDKGICNINDFGFRYRINSQTITNTQNFRSTIISVERATNLMQEYLLKSTFNKDDEKQRVLALKTLPLYRRDMFYYCISEDIKKSPIDGLRFWRNKYEQYGLSRRMFNSLFWKCVLYRINEYI